MVAGMGLVFGALFFSAGRDKSLQSRVLTKTNFWLVLSGVIHVCACVGWFVWGGQCQGAWLICRALYVSVCAYIFVQSTRLCTLAAVDRGLLRL